MKKDAVYVFYELTRSICPKCRKVIDAKVLLRQQSVHAKALPRLRAIRSPALLRRASLHVPWAL